MAQSSDPPDRRISTLRTAVLTILMLAFGQAQAQAPDAQLEAILRALDDRGEVTLARSGVTVRVFDQQVDGARVEALRFAAAGEGIRPGVLLVPGFGRGARDYLALGMRCASAGFICAAVSQPGFGGSTGPADFAGPATVDALATVLRALRADVEVDPARTAAFGYSRGALAVASLATADQALAALAVAGGIYDFESAYASIELEPIRANMLAEAGMDADAVVARSPLRRAARIRAPTLIIHGGADVNAPPAQAEMLRDALIEGGTPVEFHLYPDHAHGLPAGELGRVLFDFLARMLAPRKREMVITLDDLPLVDRRALSRAEYRRTVEDLIRVLAEKSVPAIGFVNEDKLIADGRVEPDRVALLGAWLDAGLALGNHTHAHAGLHRTSVDDFLAGVLLGERTLRPLLESRGKELRYFRHPYLHTGRDADTRNRVDAFLARHGYVVAPVTIDNADYLYAAAYAQALQAQDEDLAERLVTSYLDYMLAVVVYYEQQSMALYGRNMSHVLLLHANRLNADTLGRLLGTLQALGYRFVSLEQALQDPAYQQADAYFGPAGISWLHRWALTAGKRGAFFAGEPEVPDWVKRAASP